MKFGNNKRRPSLQMQRRTLFLAAVCGIAAFTVLLARLYTIQIRDHDYYESLAISQQLREANTSVMRGNIYDRSMLPLAASASVDNVYLSPAEIERNNEDVDLIAEKLSEILCMSKDDILEKASNSSSWYVTVAKKIEQEDARKILEFKTEYNIKGVRLEPDTKRYYPNSSLACHVIGFVGTDNTGLEGIEAKYDDYLTGSSGKTVRTTNAYGSEVIYGDYSEYIDGNDGYDVVTTIDSTIQYYVEKHLNQAVGDYDIRNGAGAIVMDVNTGAVLAMASIGAYDPNNFLEISDDAREAISKAASEEKASELLYAAQIKQWRNKVLSDTYEPGSTFKIITLAMALEEGAVNENDSFYCGGSVNVIGRTSPIRCWKDGGHGSQTLTQAVQHSCNAAFVNIGQKVGAEKFYDYCEAFGLLNQSSDPDEMLTATTGIDLSGESGSIWWSRNTFCSERNLSQLAAASFGQTFTITPLQLITAVSAAVNGGRLMQPYTVQSVISGDGEIVYEHKNEMVRHVISEETSSKVRTILEAVVGDMKEGTGKNASVSGYRIGGKTGTSEKVSLEAATGEKEYIVSFIGFAPANDPKIAVLIFLDTPSNESGIYISGGQMAAPVVGSMMADILPYLGVMPEYSNEEKKLMDVAVPDLEGMSLQEAERTLNNAGLRFRTIGDGEKITDQLPKSGYKIAKGTEIIIYLEKNPSNDAETVPNLVGMSYNEARDALSYYGIYIHSLSAVNAPDEQVVGTQSINAGEKVSHGSVIEVSLISDDESMLGKY